MAKDKLIYASAARKAILDADPKLAYCIDEIPGVDAVEVVRCKDCKSGIWDEDEQMWECVIGVDLTGDRDTYAMFHEYNDGDHFCSYGERKDNERKAD